MLTDILRSAVGAIGFMVLDGVWLGLVMSSYYRSQLASIARLTPDSSSFAPNWSSALVVYACLGIGIATFVVPRATGWLSAAAYGAALGFVVYGVYDFTNHSTLKDYPLSLAFVDLSWGIAATAICSMFVWSVFR